MLEDRDNYPPPNEVARANAEDAAGRLRAARIEPEPADDDVLGGLAVYAYGCIAKMACVTCRNTGYVGCVLHGATGAGREESGVRSWDVGKAGWPETIARIEAHFAETET